MMWRANNMRIKKLFVSLLLSLSALTTSCRYMPWNDNHNSAADDTQTEQAVTLERIRLTTEDVKKDFVYEDEFTYEGLVVTAIYSDGAAKTVTKYEVIKPDMKHIGRQDVFVVYEDVFAEYHVTVEHSPKSVISEVAEWLYADIQEDDNGFKVSKTYNAAGIDEEELMAIVDKDLIVDRFELLRAWQDGICYYLYHTNIMMSYAVCSDVIWIKDWKEVEPNTEGASETDVTKLLIRSYYISL